MNSKHKKQVINTVKKTKRSKLKKAMKAIDDTELSNVTGGVGMGGSSGQMGMLAESQPRERLSVLDGAKPRFRTANTAETIAQQGITQETETDEHTKP
jgi:hypothetical protein